MEWLVKKSCCNKQDNRHVLMLCDAGGAIKMIAEVKSDFAVKVGDLLSPLQNALYCINREKLHTVKVLSASSYSPDEWERQCTAAVVGRKISINPLIIQATPSSAFSEKVPSQPGSTIEEIHTST